MPSPSTLLQGLQFLAEQLDQWHSARGPHGELSPRHVEFVSDEIWRVIAAPTSAASDAVEYRAPEVVAGQAPTIASDIYSLALLARKILPGDVNQTSFVGALVPRVYARALDPVPGRRYADATAFVSQLVAATNGTALPHEVDGKPLDLVQPEPPRPAPPVNPNNIRSIFNVAELEAQLAARRHDDALWRYLVFTRRLTPESSHPVAGVGNRIPAPPVTKKEPVDAELILHEALGPSKTEAEANAPSHLLSPKPGETLPTPPDRLTSSAASDIKKNFFWSAKEPKEPKQPDLLPSVSSHSRLDVIETANQPPVPNRLPLIKAVVAGLIATGIVLVLLFQVLHIKERLAKGRDTNATHRKGQGQNQSRLGSITSGGLPVAAAIPASTTTPLTPQPITPEPTILPPTIPPTAPPRVIATARPHVVIHQGKKPVPPHKPHPTPIRRTPVKLPHPAPVKVARPKTPAPRMPSARQKLVKKPVPTPSPGLGTQIGNGVKNGVGKGKKAVKRSIKTVKSTVKAAKQRVGQGLENLANRF